jgi:hypothetical protein
MDETGKEEKKRSGGGDRVALAGGAEMEEAGCVEELAAETEPAMADPAPAKGVGVAARTEPVLADPAPAYFSNAGCC